MSRAGVIRQRLALLAILALAAGLRLSIIERADFWLDELWTLELSAGRGSVHLLLPLDRIIERAPPATALEGAPPWWTIPGNLGDATHPPLFFMLLRFWTAIVGLGETPVRALSLVASLAAVALLFTLVRDTLGVAPACWAALMMALAQPQIEYAVEARGYALLVLTGLGSLAALRRIERQGATAGACAVLAGCIWAMLMTHYLVGGLVAALWVLGSRLPDRRCRRAAVGSVLAACAAFALLWGPSLWLHYARFSQPDPTTAFLVDDTHGHILRTLGWWASLPARFMLSRWDQWLAWQHWYAAGIPAALLMVAPLWMLRRRPELLPWWLWLVAGTGFVAALDLLRATRQLELPRYTLAAAPGAYALLAAAALPGLGSGWRRHLPPALGTALCAVGAFVALVHPGQTPATDRTTWNWSGLGAYLRANIGRDDLLVFAAPGQPTWRPGELFLEFSHYSHGHDPAILLLTGPASTETRNQARRFPRIWLVQGYGVVDPQVLLPGFQPQDGGVIEGLPPVYIARLAGDARP